MARPHAVVVPYPGSGNINPALQLAKLLHGHGIYITFVNTEHNHRRIVAILKRKKNSLLSKLFRYDNESLLTNGHLDTTIIDWIPGMPPISLGDISSFVRTTDADEFGLRFNEDEANNCTMAGALVLNTFDGLEADVLAALRAEYPRIFTVGPLGNLLLNAAADDVAGLSLWKQDTECLAWLDAQEMGAVVYVNFGSLTVLTPQQLAEFAWGLAATGRPFLWVIRENLVVPGDGGGDALLPTGFAAATEGRRCVATWCPQDRVLRHRAVGCFVTHSGWNSTCEGVAAGVPMVCWPVFADQYTNCKYACEAWGVGVRLDAEVRREQVAGAEEMRRAAARWKAQAEAAARRGGSSYENLQSMVEVINSFSSKA
ncbi:7-deoxyloganetin glucosyltransferase-like [Oryza glaberrima]|uniref:7-deoxyloganetin glucosyltransferase-like n=1 Tax=Oryza glaberrima TaxID=4538 RepID=UPI00224C3454|nr:7-deoxyloganetin glucosyltransferase-like [Oryza glaberrima]